jgi:hypothetical protein
MEAMSSSQPWRQPWEPRGASSLVLNYSSQPDFPRRSFLSLLHGGKRSTIIVDVVHEHHGFSIWTDCAAAPGVLLHGGGACHCCAHANRFGTAAALGHTSRRSHLNIMTSQFMRLFALFPR